jgi:diadenosine tetraphosphate (Ap4A) HIT family hydrolase
MDCPICAKHRGEGPLVGPIVWEDEHCLVFHAPLGGQDTVFLGYLFLETRRHVPYLADLDDAEAAAIGRVASRLARGLRTELRADFVFSAIVGTGVAHFHQHLFARHPGTPAEYRWMNSHEWPDAPRGTGQQVTELCARLRSYLEQT